jgi:HSP20 family molecular chaperone IbpA
MKSVLLNCACRRAREIVFTVATIGLVSTCIPVPASENNNHPSESYSDALKLWQRKMSDAFRDAFKSLGTDPSGQRLTGSVSVDLREQNDAYTLRLSLPGRDLKKVEVDLNHHALRVLAPADGKARRYEQSIVLDNVPNGAKPRIERNQEDNLIVVTVPKVIIPLRPNDSPQNEPPAALSDQEHDTMEKMSRMRREMDQIFSDSFKPFSFMTDFKGFFDVSRFGSSYTVNEENGNYVVQAYLPERTMNNVNVSLDGQVLTIEAKAEDAHGNAKNDQDGVSSMAHYTQLITLPGPVKATKMKVDNKQGVVVVTLPKA